MSKAKPKTEYSYTIPLFFISSFIMITVFICTFNFLNLSSDSFPVMPFSYTFLFTLPALLLTTPFVIKSLTNNMQALKASVRFCISYLIAMLISYLYQLVYPNPETGLYSNIGQVAFIIIIIIPLGTPAIYYLIKYLKINSTTAKKINNIVNKKIK